MWRVVNITIGIALLTATVAASLHGVSIESARAERFLELEMNILAWGFGAQIALIMAWMVVTVPWDLEAVKAEQRSNESLVDSVRLTVRKFRDAVNLRHAPGLKNKAHAMIATAYLWTFVAWICVFVSMIPTIATCDC